MRVGLVGYFGFGNYGDELFVQAHRRIFDGDEVNVLRGCDGISGHDPAEVDQHDVVVIGGGDLVIPSQDLPRYWDPVLLRRPVLVAGIGANLDQPPLPDVVARLRNFFSHPNVRWVSTRDESSRRWLVDKLNPPIPVRKHPDLVGLLPFKRRTTSIRTLGLVLRAGEKVGPQAISRLYDAARRLGYTVKLLVLGTGTTAYEDLDVYHQLGTDEGPVVADNLDEITAELSSCELVLSQRFHGCLAAMLMGIPTMGLGTSGKLATLFTQVGRQTDLVELDDPRLPHRLANPPESLAPAAIQDLQSRATRAAADLRKAARKAAGDSPRSRSRHHTIYHGFLNSPKDRSARRRERSPRLLRNQNANLHPAEELSWYRSEIERRKGSSYLTSIDRLITTTPLLSRLPETIRAIVCIPVAGAAEHDHIYGTLSLYAQQDPGDLSSVVVVPYVNYPGDISTRPEDLNRLQHTLHEIRSAKIDFPELRIAAVVEHFDPQLPSRHGGIIGYLARRLYDIAMMSTQRSIASGIRPPWKDMLLVRNDADAVGMSRRYVSRLLQAADECPDTDIFQGGVRWGTHHYRNHPGYGLVVTFKEVLRALAHRYPEGYQVLPGTNGSNVAIRMSTLAAVGGVGNSSYYGAGGDDVEIGLRVYAARQGEVDHPGTYGHQRPEAIPHVSGGRRPVHYVTGAQVDTSGDRTLTTYLHGETVIHSWDHFNDGAAGYRPRSHLTSDNGYGPGRFNMTDLINTVETNLNDLAEAWFADPRLIDTALRLVVGSRDDSGQPIYSLSAPGGTPTVRFTPSGRIWLQEKLQRSAPAAAYGRRIRRHLYGELAATFGRSPMVPSL